MSVLPFARRTIQQRGLTAAVGRPAPRGGNALRATASTGSYDGANYARPAMRNFWTSRGSADADVLPNLTELRSRSRDMARNNPLALGAINTVVLNAAGTGLSLMPTPDRTILDWTEEQAHEWSRTVVHEFALLAETTDCDITRTQNFYDGQPTVLRSQLESGDLLILLTSKPRKGQTYDTRYQLIEADRLKSPNGEGQAANVQGADGKPLTSAGANRVFGGVEMDEDGAPVAYWVLRQHPGAIYLGATPTQQYDRLAAFGEKTGRRLCLHPFDRKRPDQTRGVPYLAPVMESLKQISRYTEAELMAAVVNAAYTIFIKSKTGEEGLGGMSGVPSPNVPVGDTGIELGNGLVVGLPEGTEVQFPNSMRPSTGFDPFVMAILRQVGVALELPLEVLVKHFTSSYSAARSALLEAWKFYTNRRNFLAKNFCQPFFEAWMDEAVSKGRVDAPGYFTDPIKRRAYLSADWVGDAPSSIDPLKDVQAARERIDACLSDKHTEAMALTGRNYADILANRTAEHEAESAAGLEPNVLNAAATEMVPDDSDQDSTDDAGEVDPNETPEPQDKPGTVPPAPPAPAKKAAVKVAAKKVAAKAPAKKAVKA